MIRSEGYSEQRATEQMEEVEHSKSTLGNLWAFGDYALLRIGAWGGILLKGQNGLFSQIGLLYVSLSSLFNSHSLSYTAILLDPAQPTQYSSTVYSHAYYLPDPLSCRHCFDGSLVKGYEDYGNGIAGWIIRQVVGLLSLLSQLNVIIYGNRVEDKCIESCDTYRQNQLVVL